MNKCFFLDRDGVIIKDRKNIYKTKDIFFNHGVIKALKKIKKEGFIVIVITNQSVVGRGLLSELGFEKFTDFLNDYLFKKTYLKLIDDIFYCPHHPSKGVGKYKIKCECRKPGNKMIEDAIQKWDINRKDSIMIGDKLSDYLAAKKSKLKFFYKDNSSFYEQIKNILNEKDI